VVAGVIALIALIVKYTVRFFRMRLEKKLAEEESERRQRAERSRIVSERVAKRLADNTSSVPPRGKETTKRYTVDTPAPQSSVSDDRFMDTVMTSLVINTLMNSGRDSIAGTVTKDEDSGRVGIKTEESSWGFDDSDSRKSVSSSFSSSDSSSSWSSSSSSDSGPSSDW
jgi:hypothetical protein